MRIVLNMVAAALVLAAGSGCAGDEDPSGGDGDAAAHIVVTTTILGDIVGELVGDDAAVEVLLPVGADPHDFALSARDAAGLEDADLVVVNGGGFEAGMLGVIQAAVPDDRIHPFGDHVTLDGDDPHYWLDPMLVAEGLDALVEALGRVDGLDDAAVQERAGAYRAELDALDAEIAALVDLVPPDRRVLVADHDVLGYFAARYGFEAVGAVVPSRTTGAEPSSADVQATVRLLRDRGVPALFVERSSASSLAEVVAAEAGVETVELHVESLGEPGSGAETYVDLVRTDAELIVDALA